ncbi:MAG: HupE/UreJ family protein [Verrucomicrobia bacterium]|nr:HupE/UreJ family protein [Verrucomicrobiota bacterium]
MRRWLAICVALGLGGGLVRAHDPGISTVQGTMRADAMELVVGFAPADAEQFVPPESRSAGRMTPAEFVAVAPLLEAAASQLWEARAGETVLAPRSARVQLLPGDNVSFTVVFPRPHPGAGRVTLRATKLADLPPGHRQFVIIGDATGSTITKKLLSARDDAIEVALAGDVTPAGAPAPAGTVRPTESGAPTFWGFVRLGVEHIWTGYDHLLFLFALLVACRTFKSIVAIITCFTLAHSATLALATLNVVSLPARWVEPAIAATIIFVGVENLFRRGSEPPGRWALTFGFGLIHGFGFASVLRELGVGEGGTSLAMPLFTFNAGVEIGQIVIAAVVLPAVWQLRKSEKFVARGVPALSALVAAAGLYWLLERTIFA